MEIKKVNSSLLRIPIKAYSQGVIVPCGDINLLRPPLGTIIVF